MLAVVNFYRWWTLPFSLACMAVLIGVVAYTFVRDVEDVRKGAARATKSDMGE